MKKFLKYTVVSTFLIAFLIVTVELSIIYKKFWDNIYKSPYILKEEFRKPAIFKNSNKKSIVLMGDSFFQDKFLDEKFLANILLSKQTNRNVYNLAIEGASIAEVLYILRSYDKNIELKELINGDTKIEHIIINYMPWHIKALYLSPRELFPRFDKNKGEFILDKNPIYYTETYRTLKFYLGMHTPDKVPFISFNLYALHIKEIKKEIEKIFGKDTKLSILVVKECGLENWEKLKQEGINVINLNEILGFDINTKEYQISDTNDHPNEKAWEVIVPALIKELDL